MRGSRQLKKIMNDLRRRHGKKNGVVSSGYLDFGGRPNPQTDKREKRQRYRKVESE